jgi:hypothetical protein
MTIQQTLTIPKATRHLTVELSQPVPAGTVDMVLFFPAPVKAPVENTEGLSPRPRACTSLEEALADAARRREARKADPALRSLKKWHGVLENSEAWGKDVDVVAEIRKMRDEWGDPWTETAVQNG